MFPRVPQLGNSKGRFKPNHHDLKVYFFFPSWQVHGTLTGIKLATLRRVPTPKCLPSMGQTTKVGQAQGVGGESDPSGSSSQLQRASVSTKSCTDNNSLAC